MHALLGRVCSKSHWARIKHPRARLSSISTITRRSIRRNRVSNLCVCIDEVHDATAYLSASCNHQKPFFQHIVFSCQSSPTMRCTALLLAVSPLLANAFNVVVSNDDGWAEQNVRSFIKSLTTAGFSAILSSPAENQSGTSSSDTPAKTVGSGGCQFGSCPAGSPANGFNASDTRLNVRFSCVKPVLQILTNNGCSTSTRIP